MLVIIEVTSFILIRYHKSYFKGLIESHIRIFNIHVKSMYTRIFLKNQ